MPDVFISYSAKDEELAQFVRSHLVRHQLNVFLASISINPGVHWSPQIIDALRSSEWVFLLASKNALASPNVQQEIGGAVFEKKRLVPIMWGVEPRDLPPWVAAYQGLNLTGATLETINSKMSALSAHVRSDKQKGQLVAGAVFAGVLFLLSKSN